MHFNKVKIKVTVEHPKGDIPKGSVYVWNEKKQVYVLTINGKEVSSVNKAMVEICSNMFEFVKE